MPTVGYTHEQQGFRQYANPRPYAHLKGLGRLSDGNTFGTCVQAYDANGNSVACDDSSAVIWMDANGNTVPAPTAAAAATLTPSAPSAPAASAAAAGAPTGAYLTYQGTWTVTFTQSANDIISKVGAALAAFGLKLTNSNSTVGALASAGLSTFTVQLQLLVTGPGFAQPGDAGSFVDHAFYTVTGKMPVASSTSVQSLPGGATVGGAPPPAAQSLTAWLEDNAFYIGLGIAAVVLLPKLI